MFRSLPIRIGFAVFFFFFFGGAQGGQKEQEQVGRLPAFRIPILRSVFSHDMPNIIWPTSRQVPPLEAKEIASKRSGLIQIDFISRFVLSAPLLRFGFFGKQFEVSICVYKTKIIYQPQAIACGQRKQLKEEKTQARIYVNWVQREKYHYNFMIAVKYAF